jgi:hypothetical protein
VNLRCKKFFLTNFAIEDACEKTSHPRGMVSWCIQRQFQESTRGRTSCAPSAMPTPKSRRSIISINRNFLSMSGGPCQINNIPRKNGDKGACGGKKPSTTKIVEDGGTFGGKKKKGPQTQKQIAQMTHSAESRRHTRREKMSGGEGTKEREKGVPEARRRKRQNYSNPNKFKKFHPFCVTFEISLLTSEPTRSNNHFILKGYPLLGFGNAG